MDFYIDKDNKVMIVIADGMSEDNLIKLREAFKNQDTYQAIVIGGPCNIQLI